MKETLLILVDTVVVVFAVMIIDAKLTPALDFAGNALGGIVLLTHGTVTFADHD